MEDNLKYITAPPHIKEKSDVTKIMFCFILALLPVALFAVYKYNLNALIHLVITVVVCMSTDYLYRFFVKKQTNITDGSAIVTGILLAMVIPDEAPYYIGIISGIFAILIVRHIIGGIGKFYLNPVVVSKCLLLIVFPEAMSKYSESVSNLPVERMLNGYSVNTFRMMVGNVDGNMGEICAAALLIGAIILVVTGVIDIYIPAAYILAFILTICVLNIGHLNTNYIIGQIAGGGFLLAVWFLATDYKSAPVTLKGQIIYGIILGLLTGAVRVFGTSGENIYFVLLIGNILTPLIENFTIPKPFVN